MSLRQRGYLKESSGVMTLKQYLDDWYQSSRYGQSYLKNASLKKTQDQKLSQEWFDYVVKQAKSGKFIDWKVMNDFWNLDISGHRMRRLIHDVPAGKFDPKWQMPDKGKKAKGWKKR